MTKGAVIGSPISHSLSPRIFSFLSKNLNRGNFNYEAIEVKSEDLSTFLEQNKSKYLGLNVTIPHKENILKNLDSLSVEASTVGAVNCVHFKKDAGRILSSGHNTDISGFAESLTENKVNLKGKTALILGAGGAARAVAYALGSLKAAEVLILNKTKSRAQEIAADFNSQFTGTKYLPITLENFHNKDLALIVNATPLGMENYGQPDDTKLFFTQIFQFVTSKNTVAFDLIYKPKITPFLETAERKGFSRIGGLDMLIFQALKSWEIWFEQPLQNKIEIKKDLTKELAKTSSRSERIFLTGFMGVGKSTVAKIVAEQMGWTLVDTDRAIEKQIGTSVSEVFSNKGEAFFRTLEAKIIQEACKGSKVIVALGGGALMNAENVRIIKESGLLVYLSAKEEKLAERLKNSATSRPLLRHDQSLTLIERIGNLMKAREPQYKEAHFEISTDNTTDVGVAKEVIRKLELK
jgi:shikimate dehydrogenase